LNTPLVSIVLLNWNGEKYIKDCIESIINQTYKNIEYIIVDNGSTDLSLDIISEKYSHLRIIKNETNLGFAEGMNTGIAVSSGEYILLLNLDVYLRDDYVAKAVDLFKEDKSLGCVGGIEYKWSEKGFIDQHLPSSGPYYLKKRVQLFSDTNLLNKSCYAFGVTGSLPVFRKAAVEDLLTISGHFFDPLFQTGWEDTDVRFRLFWRGWKTLYSPDLVGWHVGSGSADSKVRLIDKTLDYQQRIFRNRMYVIGKFPDKLKKRLRFFLYIANFLIIPYFMFRSPKSLIALYSAHKEVKKNSLPISLQQNLIQKTANVEVDEIFKYFKKF
jgi:GT2 family glycosyltransferase